MFVRLAIHAREPDPRLLHRGVIHRTQVLGGGALTMSGRPSVCHGERLDHVPYQSAIPLIGANAIPVSNSNLVGGPRNGLNSPLPRQSVFNRLNIGVTSNSNNQIAGILGKAPCCLLHLSVLDVWPVIISGPTAKISLDVWPVTVLSILLVTAGSRLD
jgi:hypothetical protein